MMALGIAGILLYLLTGWFYLASGLTVPQPWYLLLVGAWLAGWWAVVQVWRERRELTPLVAVAAAVLWLVVVQGGGWLFDWTA